MGLGTMEQRTEGMKKQAQELIEQAYNRGFKAGYNKAFTILNENLDLVTSEAEEKGRNEAWEAARKIILSKCDGGLSIGIVEKIFDESMYYNILKDYHASEVIEGIREYEKKKEKADNEIRVGDEVYLLDENYHSVVTCIYYKKAVCITQNGKYDVNDIDNLHKTGRHFPEIVEVLKKMQEGE